MLFVCCLCGKTCIQDVFLGVTFAFQGGNLMFAAQQRAFRSRAQIQFSVVSLQRWVSHATSMLSQQSYAAEDINQHFKHLHEFLLIS